MKKSRSNVPVSSAWLTNWSSVFWLAPPPYPYAWGWYRPWGFGFGFPFLSWESGFGKFYFGLAALFGVAVAVSIV